MSLKSNVISKSSIIRTLFCVRCAYSRRSTLPGAGFGFVRSEESWRSRWACYPRRITPSEISIILYIILKPNPIVLLFIQNNSYFKNKLKHAYLHQCQFYVIISSSAGCVAADPRIVSTRRLRVSATQATPSSNSWKIQDIKECLGRHAFFKSQMSSVKLFFAVLAMLFAVGRLFLLPKTCQMFSRLQLLYQNNTNLSPGHLGCRITLYYLDIANVFQIWSKLASLRNSRHFAIPLLVSPRNGV